MSKLAALHNTEMCFKKCASNTVTCFKYRRLQLHTHAPNAEEKCCISSQHDNNSSKLHGVTWLRGTWWSTNASLIPTAKLPHRNGALTFRCSGNNVVKHKALPKKSPQAKVRTTGFAKTVNQLNTPYQAGVEKILWSRPEQPDRTRLGCEDRVVTVIRTVIVSAPCISLQAQCYGQVTHWLEAL